jgi:Protein of unknown function DUF72
MTGGVDLCIRRHSAIGLAAVLCLALLDGGDQRLLLWNAVACDRAAWHDHTPKGFEFAWKASKFITHWKRLSDKCENSIALMDSRLRVLERKISVVLFQLPPNFWKMRNGSAPFSQCCLDVIGMLSNSDLKTGTSIEC